MVTKHSIRCMRGAIRKGAYESAVDEILQLLDGSLQDDTVQAIYRGLWDVFSEGYQNPAFSNAEELQSKDWSKLLCMDVALMRALSERTDESAKTGLLMWADLCGQLASGVHQVHVVSTLRERQRTIYEDILGPHHSRVLSLLLEEAARAAHGNDLKAVEKLLAEFEQRTTKTSKTPVDVNAHAWRDLAEYYFGNQEFSRAKQMWLPIAEYFRKNHSPTYWGVTDCYFGAADCCLKLGQHLEAEVLYRRAIGNEIRRMAREVGGDFKNSSYYTPLRNAYINLLLLMKRHDDVAKFAQKYPEGDSSTDDQQVSGV